MKIKICGITNLADARYAAAAGADFLGYIQHKDSPRYAEPALVSEINAWVFGPQSVGVFVDEDPETVNRVVESAGFDLVQLHGDETVSDCKAINSRVIKAFRVKSTTSAGDLRKQIDPYLEHIEYILLDSYNPDLKGGTGIPFSWDVARDLVRDPGMDIPVLLAGGLEPENVVEAIHKVQPAGVDASSRLEESPGRKNPDKLRQFIDRVRSARIASPKATNDHSRQSIGE